MRIAAAASLQDVVTALNERFTAMTGSPCQVSFASSGTLAQQIKASPQADVFLSASERWMRAVQEAGRFEADRYETLWRNQLVVLSHPQVRWADRPFEALDHGGIRLMAMGDPTHVPAGRYAQAWLDAWSRPTPPPRWLVESERVFAPDARAILTWVEARQDVVGIAYATDYRSWSDRVQLVHRVPVAEGPEIRYFAGLIKAQPNLATARQYLAFLQSDLAREIVQAHGFFLDAAPAEPPAP